MDPTIHIRPATKADLDGLVEVFFRSFNARFWQHLMPDTPENRRWWHDSWVLSLENPQDRSFVAEDTANGNKIVAFSRWMVPQLNGDAERPWPPLREDEWDMELCGAFFGGMEANHHELMYGRPHWCMSFLILPVSITLTIDASPRAPRRARRVPETRHSRRPYPLGN